MCSMKDELHLAAQGRNLKHHPLLVHDENSDAAQRMLGADRRQAKPRASLQDSCYIHVLQLLSQVRRSTSRHLYGGRTGPRACKAALRDSLRSVRQLHSTRRETDGQRDRQTERQMDGGVVGKACLSLCLSVSWSPRSSGDGWWWSRWSRRSVLSSPALCFASAL